MATIENIELENNAFTQKVESDWFKRWAYSCHIALISEDDGSFSAVVLNLPGCGSCGPTEEEAIKNVREAISGVIESHNAAGEEIPWTDTANDDIPDGSKRIWILVDAAQTAVFRGMDVESLVELAQNFGEVAGLDAGPAVDGAFGTFNLQTDFGLPTSGLVEVDIERVAGDLVWGAPV